MPDIHATDIGQPRTTRLADIRPPVEKVDLTFDLNETTTRIASRLALRRVSAAGFFLPRFLRTANSCAPDSCASAYPSLAI